MLTTISILVVFIMIMIIFAYMYYKGAYYYNKIEHCQEHDVFCGYKIFDYTLPDDLKDILLKESINAKRVNILNWKYGKTLSTKEMPVEMIDFYINFSNNITDIINEQVYITSLELPTSCCLLVYDKPGDFINWHFDVNYFDGRFFTVLIPITTDESCTKFVYKNKYTENESIDLGNLNKSIIFEGENLFHMASKLCEQDQPRLVLSLQYSTNPNINRINKTLMKIKDSAYIPLY